MSFVNPLLQALMLKEAEKREKPPYGAFTFNRETGAKLLKTHQYKKADEYLSAAFALEKDNIRTILKRSTARDGLTNFDDAIKDAETVEYINPGNLPALYQKADATGGKNEFENALVLFHRGKKRRKYPNYFEIGKMQAEETIEDCIGRHAGGVLAGLYPVIKELERQNILDSSDVINGKLGTEQKKDCALKNVMTAKYLEGLNEDLRFFKNLLNHKGIRTPNKEGSQKISDIIQDCFNFLEGRLETLRTRRPYYVIQLSAETRSEELRRKERERKFGVITNTRSECKRIIEKLRNLCAERDMKEFMMYAERAIKYINSKSLETELPNRSEYLLAIYNIIALTYLEQKTFFVPWCKDEDCKKNLIKLFFDVPLYSELKIKEAYTTFCCPARNYRNIIDVCNEELSNATDKHIRLFLLHEVAMGYSLIKDYDKAEETGEKCLREAKELTNMAWAINAIMIMVKSKVRKKNKTAALFKLAEARKIANKLQRQDVLDYVIKCKSVIETLDTELIQEKPKSKKEKVSELMKTEGMVRQRSDLVRRRHLLGNQQRSSLMNSKRHIPRLSKIKTNGLLPFTGNIGYSYIAYD